MILFNNVYKNKKVLVTGHTGFKGSWLCAWLIKLSADVYGLSKNIPTQPSHFEAIRLKEKINHFEADVRSFNDVKKIIDQVKPDFVFHLAAQPIVRTSYIEPAATIETNVIGTMNILEALRQSNNKCCAIMITSDKCYDNVEWFWGYKETDALGGKDPYSASKGAAELVIKTYAKAFFSDKESNVKVVSTRAGNVVGGGDWAKDRIVPDCMRAWAENLAVIIRSPNATRPWQHVLEPLSGYLRVGQMLYENPALNSEPFNFGPPTDQNHTVLELVNEMKKHWNGNTKIIEDAGAKECGLLKLNCDKALTMLGWKATLNFSETADMTVNWYKGFYEKKPAATLTDRQIEEYTTIAKSRNQAWVRV
jgi:CDP-glucose 4,6-dehydratase